MNDIMKTARETREEATGVRGNLADEVVRLRKERDALAVEIACLHDDTKQGITRAIQLMKWGQGPSPDGVIGAALSAHDTAACSGR